MSETVTCEYCGHEFDLADVAVTSIPSATLYRCPRCSRWSEGE